MLRLEAAARDEPLTSVTELQRGSTAALMHAAGYKNGLAGWIYQKSFDVSSQGRVQQSGASTEWKAAGN